MSESIFDVLININKDLADLGYQIEKDFFQSPSSAIMHGRQFGERMLEKVCELEGQVYLISSSQYERLKMLSKEGILDEDIYNDFNEIRIIGNKAVHAGTHNDYEYAHRIHKRIYQIIKWYVECYGDASIEVPIYKSPINQNDADVLSRLDVGSLVEEKLQEKLEEYFKANMPVKKDEKIENKVDKQIDEQENVNDENINKDSYEYTKLKGSYLLNEISKLSSKAKEGVESYKGLNPFKKYLHVERSIQQELIEMIKEAKDSEESQLVLLCGSVGDGKSHLLAYLNEEHSELLSDFYIHNDATESHDPKLTATETLDNLLDCFNDERIDNSNKKIILAINLGVLNNFLEEDFAKEKYKKFNDFINKSNIFNQELISSSHKNEHFKLVSFGDYNIYELTENGTESFYIESLLNRIVNKSDDNPFYQAYLKDKEEGIINTFMINYEILSKSGVTNKITDLLVSSIVKNKKILGTRELLNFVYELMVPPIIEDDSRSIINILKEMDNLLPNLIFNSDNRGELLRIISKNDPIRIRHKNLDKLLIKLNIVNDIIPVLEEYFNKDICMTLKELFKGITNLNDLSANEKEKVIETIIRLLALSCNDEISYIFEDEAYNSFMKYLYYYNKGEMLKYKAIFEEVKTAIYKWNGSPKSKYIYLNKNLSNFKIAEELDFKAHRTGSCPKNEKIKLDRFKGNIALGYEAHHTKGIETLEMDYQLYKKIVEINKGYCTSKNDKEEAVIFVEFIEEILSHGNMEEELLIESKNDKKQFILRYEDNFGDEEFVFERVGE